MPTPSKFTQPVVKAFLEAIRYGASIRTAAAEAGITHPTAIRWIEKGKDADPESRFGRFYTDFEAAQAHPIMRALRSVYNEIPDDPKLAFKVLERRERGYAPPMPYAPPPPSQVVINLALADGAAVPSLPSTVIEVADESNGEGGTAQTDSA